MKVYIKIDKNNRVSEADTNKLPDHIEVDIDKEIFDSLDILNYYYENGKLIKK